jgi:hypothetical protein
MLEVREKGLCALVVEALEAGDVLPGVGKAPQEAWEVPRNVPAARSLRLGPKTPEPVAAAQKLSASNLLVL